MSRLGRILFVVAIVLMALTAAVTLLSGAGTTCVAWNAEKYPPFRAIVPYKPLYQALVVLTLLTAGAAVGVTFALLRRRRWAYAGALAVLVVNVGLTAIQMFYSSRLRGKTAPSDMRLYVSLVTLAILLVLRLPPLWKRVGLAQPQEGSGSAPAAAGLAAFMGGVMALATPAWAGPSHMLEGSNLVLVLATPLTIGGWLLVTGGLALLAAATMRLPRRQPVPEPVAP